MKLAHTRLARLPSPLLWGGAAAVLTLIGVVVGLRLQVDGVAVFWPAAGIAAGFVIVTRGADRQGAIGGILLALAIGNISQGRSLTTSLIFMSGNLSEALLLTWMLGRHGHDPMRPGRPRTLALLLALGVAIPVLVGLPVAAGLRWSGHAQGSFGEVLSVWVSSHALGLIATTPAVLLLADTVRRVQGRNDYPFAVLMSAALLAALMPLALLVAYGIGSWSDRQRADEIRLVARNAEITAAAVERELRSYIETAEMLSGAPQLQSPTLEGAEARLRDLTRRLGGHFVLVDRSYRQLINTSQPPGTTLPSTSNPEAYRPAFETGRSGVHDLVIGTTSGQPRMLVRAPVTVGDEVRYVLNFSPRPDAIRDIVEDTSRPDGWFAAVLDGTGRIVARSDRHHQFYGRPSAPRFLADMTGRSGIVRNADLDGRVSVAAYHGLPSNAWRAVIWVPRATLEAPLRTAQQIIAALIAAAFATSFGVAWLAGRALAGPARRLVASARELGSGPISFRPTLVREANVIGEALAEAGLQRSRAEAARDEARRFAEGLVQTAPMLLYVYDLAERRNVYIGPQIGPMLGFTPAEIAERGDALFDDLFHPDDLARITEHHAGISAGTDDGPFEIEYRMIAQDGRWLWLLSRETVYLRGVDGRVQQILGAAQDITSRKAAEIALRESERRARAQMAELTSIYDTAPIGLCTLDRDLRFVRINERLAEINGVPAADHIGRTVREVVPDIADAAERIAVQVFGTGQPVLDIDISGATPAQPGVVRHWLEQWVPLEDESGAVTGLSVVAEETTQRKHAEAALRESEARLRAIGDNLPDSAVYQYAMTPDGARRFHYLSAGVESLNAVSATAAMEDPTLLTAQLSAEDGSRLIEVEERSARDLSDFAFEAQIRRPDGETRWMRLRSRPRRQNDGTIVWDGVQTDMTERKQAEEELVQRNRQLALLAETSQALLLASSRETDVLDEVFRDIADLIGIESYYFFRPSAEPDVLELALSGGTSGDDRRAFSRMRFGELLCGRVAERRQRLIVEDLQHSAVPGSAVLRARGATSYAGFPLVASGELIGTIAFISRRRTHFRDDEIRTVQTICDHVATTLERGRLQRDLATSERRLAIEVEDLRRVHELSLALAELPDVGSVLKETLRVAAGLASVTVGGVQLREGDGTLSMVELMGFDDATAARFASVGPEDFSTCVTAMTEKRRVIVDDLTREPRYVRFVEAVAPHVVRGALSTPLIDSAGEVSAVFTLYWPEPHQPSERELRLLDLCAGIAARHLERNAATEAVRIREERFQAAEQAAAGLVYDWDVPRDRLWRSDGITRLAGWLPDEIALTKEAWFELLYPEDRLKIEAQLPDKLIGADGRYSLEYRIRHKEGHWVWVWDRGRAEIAPDGNLQRLVGATVDISERKQREEQVFLLMKEVNHRAKNMLGLVQAIARQTMAADPQEFVQRFGERIQALSANQDLLVNNAWTGVQIADLVRAQLAPFKDLIGSRIALDGPSLRFTPAAAQAIGLALHELATNAGKYGALSNDDGKVAVSWRRESDRLMFEWQERDGPPVTPPRRKGFGSTVINSLARISVYGEVALDYAPSGFAWKLTCPLDKAIDTGGIVNASNSKWGGAS